MCKYSFIGLELETDIQWRRDEMRDIEERLLNNDLQKEGQVFDRRRKSLWVMLYSHYEGFFKFALHVYASARNRTRMDCGNAHKRLVAWSLDTIFHDIENNESKEPFFKHQLPEEQDLHRLYRRSKIVETWRQLEERTLNIPDTAYSTKANLDYIRLQQLLYQAGFDHNAFSEHEGSIARLVIRRHSIAHGDPENRTSGIQGDEYQKIRLITFDMMTHFSQLIVKSLSEQSVN